MNPTHVSLLTRTELRRRYRAVRGDYELAFLVVLGLVLLLPLGGVVIGLFLFGRAVGDGSLPASLSFVTVRGTGGLLVFAVAVLNTIRTIQAAAVPKNADGVLTMADHSEVVASLLAVETVAGAGVALVPGVLGAVAFGIGAGSPLAAVTFLIAVVCVVALGSVLGIAVGLVVRNALARSKTLSRYRTPATVALFLAYMYAIVATDFDSAFEPLARALGRTPLGWYGDLALLPLGVESDPALAGGAVALAAVGVAVLSAATDRLANLLWYVEPVEASTGETDSSGIGGITGVPRPVARVARRSWLRAWRSPIRLIYVVYPLFLLVAPITEAIQTGAVPGYLAGTIAVYGAWATGAAFTLNPLGDEGDVLPVTLSSPVSGREFITGCGLAGVLVGVPLSVVAALVSAVLAGNPPAAIAGAVALAVLLPVVATGLASGIGVSLPRFETVDITRGREAVIPSLLGFAAYSIVLVIAAAPGSAVLVAPGREAVTDATGLSTAGVVGVGVGGTVLVAGALAVLSYRHAVRTFDSYYLE